LPDARRPAAASAETPAQALAGAKTAARTKNIMSGAAALYLFMAYAVSKKLAAYP
jgi:hypothetical protein